jgi:hypothetical protein
MKNNYEERRQNRIDYANDQADKNNKLSDQLYNRAKEMGAVIPMGQPILMGHHSEKRDRNYREKIHNTFGKSVKAWEKAKYYADKAEAIENNTAIFADDPQATEKLRQRVEELQNLQDTMKLINKLLKKKDKQTFLKIEGVTEDLWQKLSTPDRVHGIGFPRYKLQNNNANLKRLKLRLQNLEYLATKTSEEITIGEVVIKANMEANRVQIFFPGKPAEEFRATLKKNGFRWAPSEKAWQRHYTVWAFRLAQTLAAQYQ